MILFIIIHLMRMIDVDSEDVFSVRIVRIPLNGTLHEVPLSDITIA